MNRLLSLGMVLLLGLAAFSRAADPASAPSEKSPFTLLPWPKSLELGGADGALTLKAGAKIVATDDKLKPLAAVLADDLHMITGLTLAVGGGDGDVGDIVLKIDPQLRAEADIWTTQGTKVVQTRDYAHTIAVTDRVTITGFDYRATAEGTATLLQLLKSTTSGIEIPRVVIKDWPYADYTAAMVDLGRRYNSLEDLRQIVQLCRAWKVRYLDLHMTDDQAWTFPSTAFPKLGKQNGAVDGPACPRYDLADLKALVKYADERGVTIVPQLEAPGHSGNARGTMPEIFGYVDPATGKSVDQGMMNITNPKLYPAMETLIGEMLDVFASSPYFNIGYDEVSGLPEVLKTPQAKAFMEEHKLADGSALIKYFALAMDDMVKKHGKKSLIWEGAACFSSPDLVVLTWDGNSHQAERLQADHIPTITVPWDLGVPWPEWNMFVCNGSMLKRTDVVLGAMLPAWEQKGEVHIRWLRDLPKRQERTWGPDNLFTEAGFARRRDADDAAVDRMLFGFTIVQDQPIAGDLFTRKLLKAAKLSLPMGPGVGTIHFTTDGSEPTAKSPLWKDGFLINDSLTMHARLFGAAGEPLRPTWRQPFTFDPLSITVTGVTEKEGKQTTWFATKATVTLATATPGGTIRYTTNGADPVAASPAYAKPLELADTTKIKARWFDAGNTPRGAILAVEYNKLASMTDDALNKKVTLLIPEKIENKELFEEVLTDGIFMHGQEWNSPEVARFGGSDAEMVIDLEKAIAIKQVGIRCLYCQEIGIFPSPKMTVWTSPDNKTFTELGQTTFTAPDNHNDRGVTIKTFVVDAKASVTARYVKIHANNIGMIPNWHPVKGVPGHLMIDEVFVNPKNLKVQ